MVYVTGLFFANLPFGIAKNDLIRALVQQFPEEFEEPFINETLQVEVFIQQKGERKVQAATAKGFKIDLQKLLRRAEGKVFLSSDRVWRIYADRGEKRVDGKFLKSLHPDVNRARQLLRGNIHKKPLEIFNPEFLQSVPLFGGQNYVFIKKPRIKKMVFEQAGQLGHISCINEKLTKLHYKSSLEALQAIIMLNNAEWPFCDEKGQGISFDNAISIGIGKAGKCLKICDFSGKGYVPFSEISENIFDMRKIEDIGHQIECWRCETNFEVIGIDKDLNFVATKCQCQYDRSLDVMNKNRAYSWEGESFTRMIVCNKIINGEKITNLLFFHQPLQESYSDPKEYREIVAPVLQDEWKTFSESYKRQNRCHAVLKEYALIEKLTKQVNAEIKVETDVYSVTLTIATTPFWKSENLFKIGALKLDIAVSNRQRDEILEHRKAKVTYIVDHSDNHSSVIAKVRLTGGMIPVIGGHVQITPKPIKTEYKQIQHVIDKWVEKPTNYNHLNCLVQGHLDISFPEDFNTERFQKRRFGINQTRLSALKNTLNAEQKVAVEVARKNPISIIQGPPGTGKTLTGAALVATLYVREKGTIVCTAPSNFAANNFACMIARICEKHGLRIKILRVFSKKRERKMAEENIIELGASTTVLHQGVRNSTEWLQGENFASIRQKFEEKKLNMMTTEEENDLENHITQLEHQHFDASDVIVSTTGTLTDNRINSWNKDKKKIISLIVDEAGMLNQAATIPMMIFGQRRTVLIGDQQQLRSQMQSFSAEMAGLPFSVIDWLKAIDEDLCSIPWTMLTKQHRMAPDIRSIVSKLSYYNELEDAECITNRANYYIKIKDLFCPPLQKSVYVMDHKFNEKRIGTSYMNQEESLLCVNICNNLLKNNISPKDVVVLTLYEAQRLTLQEMLTDKGIEVTNVDGFQGKESKFVILCMVRGSDNGDVGFAAFINRLNVALSRAMELLIILCNMKTFGRQKGKSVKTFVALLKEHADIRPA